LELDNLKKIERYINGDGDDSDTKYIESLLAEGDNNHFLRENLRKDWENMLKSDTQPETDFDHLLDKIHYEIWRKDNLKRQRPINKLLRVYMKAAAIILFPILIILTLHFVQVKNPPIGENSASYTIYAPMGSRVAFTLPDGSKGMLNSGSHLSYSFPFDNNRKVGLDGEAWFAVKHDEIHPFEINAGNSKIEVLGTKLNVSAYPEENYIEVVLQEGKVDFIKNNGLEKLSMRPSERLVFQNDKIIKSTVDTAKYTSWIQGKLVFRGDNMPEVVRRIERWYNIKVNIADKALEKYSFRATFEDDSLEEVMRCFALTSPIGYKISPRTLLKDGTYTKAEVTIYKLRS
jgi:transmembrane sensor